MVLGTIVTLAILALAGFFAYKLWDNRHTINFSRRNSNYPQYFWPWWFQNIGYLCGVTICLYVFYLLAGETYAEYRGSYVAKSEVTEAISRGRLPDLEKRVNDKHFLYHLSKVQKEDLNRFKNRDLFNLLLENVRGDPGRFGVGGKSMEILGETADLTILDDLVNLLVSEHFGKYDAYHYKIISILENIGDSRAVPAIHGVLSRYHFRELERNKANAAIGKLGDIRPEVVRACQEADSKSLKLGFKNAREMYQIDTTWRYDDKQHSLWPPFGEQIDTSSRIRSVACIERHTKKVSKYERGIDAIEITWAIDIVDLESLTITAQNLIKGPPPSQGITVNKFKLAVGKYEDGVGNEPLTEYHDWLKELPINKAQK